MNSVTLSYERDGSTPELRWIELSDGRVGLLKKDVSKQDLLMENEYEAVASFFGLDVSPCWRKMNPNIACIMRSRVFVCIPYFFEEWEADWRTRRL